MESRNKVTDVNVKRVAKASQSFCDSVRKGRESSCIQLWPGQLDRYCNGCINYAKEKVIAKYRHKR